MGAHSQWSCLHKQEESSRKLPNCLPLFIDVHELTRSVVNKPNSSSLNTELSMLEERVKQSQIELANEQEAYDNVSHGQITSDPKIHV